MAAERITSIENIIIEDQTSVTGKSIIGFNTYYGNGRFTHSCAMYDCPDLILYAADGDTKKVQIDGKIEPIDIYHGQYGIPVSNRYNCFFITSWRKGIYCCNLDTGKIQWQYKLKHAQSIILFDDYLVCDFQEIGLRKLSYEGMEIAKYPITTYQAFFRLQEYYVFCGPNRGKYNIIDTRTMEIWRKISSSVLSPSEDSLIILGIEGDCNDFTVRGFENEQPFERHIYL